MAKSGLIAGAIRGKTSFAMQTKTQWHCHNYLPRVRGMERLVVFVMERYL